MFIFSVFSTALWQLDSDSALGTAVVPLQHLGHFYHFHGWFLFLLRQRFNDKVRAVKVNYFYCDDEFLKY